MSANETQIATNLAATSKFDRRKFLRLAAKCAAVASVPLLIDTFFVEPHWIDFVERDLPIRGLPEKLVGKRLCHISDIHVGRRVSDDYLIQSFQRVAALEPDLVVMTGDFVTCQHGVAPLEQAKKVYEHIPQGKLGTVGVLGNHDFGFNFNDNVTAVEINEMLENLGVTMLRNRSTTIEGLSIVGFDDLLGTRIDSQAAFAGTSAAEARLVLVHNPDAADCDLWRGYEGWILSGHTHGGQCKPPFFPPPLLPVKNRRYTAGEFELSENRKMYINRGLGHLFPVRFNCRPEITMFRLTVG